jgi:hypothetical protein
VQWRRQCFSRRLLGLGHENLGVVVVEVGFDGYRKISYQWKNLSTKSFEIVSRVLADFAVTP